MSQPKRRKCAHCGRERMIHFFYRDKKGRDGYKVQCKDCSSRYRKRATKKPPPAQAKKSPEKTPVATSESEIFRDALLRLKERHAEEFERLVTYERWRRKMASIPPEERWSSFGEYAS